MWTSAARNFDAILHRLCRNPVLTAMMVTSLIFGVTASVAGVAVWRASSACIARTSAPRNVARVLTDAADLDIGVGQTTQSDSPHSRKFASACPCITSVEWHWQQI